MKYNSSEEACLNMNNWAETSQSPILAVVYDDETYRVVEADENGVFVILDSETIVDTVWTVRRSDVEQFKVENAYSIAFCYNTSYAQRETIRVPHGTTDLSPFLDEAMLRAHDTPSWGLFRNDGPTFVDAISQGEGVSPWSNRLTVPEAYSERGERPVVVVRKRNDSITSVLAQSGEVHILVVDDEAGLISRQSPAQCAALKPPCFELTTKVFAAEDLLHRFYEAIQTFDDECSATSDTDTGKLWEMFNNMRQQIVDTVGPPPDRLPF